MHKTIFGLFENFHDLEKALQELDDKGFTKDDVSLIAKESTKITKKLEVDTDSSDEIKDGAITGGLIGAVLGLLVTLTAITVPVVGALFVTGPLMTALGLTGVVGATASAGLTGAIAGGLVAGLVDLGVDKKIAEQYEQGIKENKFLLGVYLKDENYENSITDILEDNGATAISTLEKDIRGELKE